MEKALVIWTNGNTGTLLVRVEISMTTVDNFMEFLCVKTEL